MTGRVRQGLVQLMVPLGGIVAVTAQKGGAGETVERGHSCRAALACSKSCSVPRAVVWRSWGSVTGKVSTGTLREHSGGLAAFDWARRRCGREQRGVRASGPPPGDASWHEAF